MTNEQPPPASRCYAAIVRSKRVQSKGQVMTQRGERFWVTIDEWGLSTGRLNDCMGSSATRPPARVATWLSKEKVDEALKDWGGHPWWCAVLDYEIVELTPVAKTVFSHFEITQKV